MLAQNKHNGTGLLYVHRLHPNQSGRSPIMTKVKGDICVKHSLFNTMHYAQDDIFSISYIVSKNVMFSFLAST